MRAGGRAGGRADGRTDMTKRTVALGNFIERPQKLCEMDNFKINSVIVFFLSFVEYFFLSVISVSACCSKRVIFFRK